MKSFLRSLSVVAVLALVAAAPAHAAVETYTFDQAHTHVGFSIRHVFTPVKGEFKEVTGSIVVDRDNLSNSKVEVKIPAASINTNNEKRDGHLKGEDFFFIEKNPEITFVSKSITVGKDNKGTMSGDLTMRGVTKPVTLDVEILGFTGTGPGSVAGFSARGVLNRKDFGINWNKTLDQGGTLLSDDVKLEIDVEARIPKPAPPAGAEAKK
jgi:polyisoprenoid-binding protein YceI